MSNAEGSSKNGGYSTPNPTIERLRFPNSGLLADCSAFCPAVRVDIAEVRGYEVYWNIAKDLDRKMNNCELWFLIQIETMALNFGIIERVYDIKQNI